MTHGGIQSTSSLERTRNVLLWVTAGAAVVLGVLTLTGHGDGTLGNVLLGLVIVGGVLMGIAWVMHLLRGRDGRA